jgi:hypothetical protein
MRHVLLPCAIATGTPGMGEATSAALLVAPGGLALRTAPGALRALAGAVDLTAVARAAHQHLDSAARAHKGSGTGLHPHSRSSRRAQSQWQAGRNRQPVQYCPCTRAQHGGVRRRCETWPLGPMPYLFSTAARFLPDSPHCVTPPTSAQSAGRSDPEPYAQASSARHLRGFS